MVEYKFYKPKKGDRLTIVGEPVDLMKRGMFDVEKAKTTMSVCFLCQMGVPLKKWPCIKGKVEND